MNSQAQPSQIDGKPVDSSQISESPLDKPGEADALLAAIPDEMRDAIKKYIDAAVTK